jgi:hypothetical protein
MFLNIVINVLALFSFFFFFLLSIGSLFIKDKKDFRDMFPQKQTNLYNNKVSKNKKKLKELEENDEEFDRKAILFVSTLFAGISFYFYNLFISF